MRYLACLAVLALTTAASAQDAAIAEGKRLLARLVTAHAKLGQLTASYTQLRTTSLVKRPLVAKGKLAFRREPGCVVFRVEEPRQAVIRLDDTHYEVLRPDQNRLERFVLANDEMPRLLFDALAPTQAKMDHGFTVEQCEAVAGEPGRRRVHLAPSGEKARRVAARITLVIDVETAALCGFGYRDPRGDDVSVELSQVQISERAEDALFQLQVPRDAKVIVQRLPEPAAPEPPRTDVPKPGAPVKPDR